MDRYIEKWLRKWIPDDKEGADTDGVVKDPFLPGPGGGGFVKRMFRGRWWWKE